jgi:hypothetical protein
MTDNARHRAGTRLAMASGMRVPGLLTIAGAMLHVVPASATPASEPLWKAEIQAGYGVSVGGSGAAISVRPTPVTINAVVGVAMSDDPPLSIYGGLTAETLDRSAVGAVAGLELRPYGSHLHVLAGASALMMPYTLYGVTVGGGVCVHPARVFGLCFDVIATAFLGGSDLPEGRALTQTQLALGVVFDAP